MIHCGSADPLRQRIYQMKSRGTSDDQIVNTIVREEGVVALSAPPSEGWGGLITWIMPAVALLIGFFIYSAYVRRIRQQPVALSAEDHEMIDRYRAQMEVDVDDSSASPGNGRR
jgi:cytochrome c-type biogenesis protein CcmH/NrfF